MKVGRFFLGPLVAQTRANNKLVVVEVELFSFLFIYEKYARSIFAIILYMRFSKKTKVDLIYNLQEDLFVSDKGR